MASHKTVTTHRASKKTITAPRTAVTLATATVGSIALVPGLAHADPSANLNDVKNQVNNLHQQAEQASEAYDQAATNLAALQNKVNQIQARITAEQTQLTNAQSSLGSLAAAQYRAGGVDSSLELMLSAAPDSFLQQATAMAEVSSHSAASMKTAQEIKRQLDQDKTEASADLQQLQKTRDQMAQNKTDIDAKEKQAQALLDSLTPTQRTQYTQQQSAEHPAGRSPPTGAAAGAERPRGDRGRLRRGPGRQAVRLRRRRPAQLRLLRPDDGRLGRRRGVDVALLLGAGLRVPGRSARRTSPSATW